MNKINKKFGFQSSFLYLKMPWYLGLWFNVFKHSTKASVVDLKYLSKLIVLKSVGINSINGSGIYTGFLFSITLFSSIVMLLYLLLEYTKNQIHKQGINTYYE